MMDQRARQAIAERLGLSGEEYDALQGGDLTPLIAGRVSDPLLALFLSTSMRPAAEHGEADVETAERKLVRARHTIRALREDLSTADTMLRYVAEVFGACETCWGRDSSCPRCTGRGTPGSSVPLEEELLTWVVPALQRLGLRIERATAEGAQNEVMPVGAGIDGRRQSW
jgi:hypothetical protein